LKSFRALRLGDPLPIQKTPSFEICGVPSAALGGAVVAWRIKSWINSPQIAIISPVKRDTSPFVNNVVHWVSTQAAKTKRSNATAGPYQIYWEYSEEEVLNETLTSLGISQDLNSELDVHDLIETARLLKAVDIQNWFLRQLRLRGMKKIISSEACDNIRRIVHQRRAFGFVFPRKFFALTVHQAKNQEFDSVIVLWPMRLRDNPEQIRRLLYNAITRAKRRAIIIVEDPRNNRLTLPPFRSP